MRATPVRAGALCGIAPREPSVKVNGSYVFAAPAVEVWDLLLDPQVLLQVIPGLQKVDVNGDDIVATATIGVGPVKGVFSGKLSLLEQRRPSHVRIVGEGKGGPGFLKGSCTIDAAEDGGRTTINYLADVQIGGTLATVGQRLVDATTQSIMQQGFTAFNRVLGERQEAARLSALAEAERLTWEAALRSAEATLHLFPRWFAAGLCGAIIAVTLWLAFSGMR